MALTNMGFKDKKLVSFGRGINREGGKERRREEEEEAKKRKKRRGRRRNQAKVWKLTLIMELTGSMEL